MCGIAGILDLDRQLNKKDLQAICNVIRHRGPDEKFIILMDL